MEQQNSSTSNEQYSVEIHVVGHYKRATQAHNLSDELYADYTWIDDGTLGEWKNHYRAWTKGVYSEATHVCVLQDDAVPVEHFSGALIHAIEQRPDDMLGLYVGNGRPHAQEVLEATQKADQVGASWLATDALCWGVGTVVPTSLISEMLLSVKKVKAPYDQRLSAWLHYSGRNAYYTWPSLVDHEDGPSLAWKGNQGVRKAHRVGVPDWNDVVVEFDRYPNWISRSKLDKR